MSEIPGLASVKASGLQNIGVPPARSTIPKSVRKIVKLDTVGISPSGQSAKKFEGLISLWETSAIAKARKLNIIVLSRYK